jgi:predicted RNA-binding protein Jag
MRQMTPLSETPGLVARWCAMLGLDIAADFEPSGNDRLFPNRLCLSGQDATLLLSGRAQALDALQHLLHEAQGEKDDSRLVYLDIHGTRLFRMKELLAMAQLAGKKARETGSFVFGSLTPKERRWVHITLGDEPDLETHSDGLGAIKKLTVARKVH